MTTTRERVARALAEARGAHWDSIPEWRRHVFRSIADAAIRAMSEEVEAAFYEGVTEGHSLAVRRGCDTPEELWAESDACARLKEAGHDAG